MSVGMAAFLLVLVVLIALAVASFFRHTLAALTVFVAIPAGLVLRVFLGTTHTVLVIGLAAVIVALIHTIGDTLRVLRTAKRTERRRVTARAQRPTSTRHPDRERIAA
jgi:carbon starvation protein CstA